MSIKTLKHEISYEKLEINQGFIWPVLLGHFSGGWTHQYLLLLMVTYGLIKINIVKTTNRNTILLIRISCWYTEDHNLNKYNVKGMKPGADDVPQNLPLKFPPAKGRKPISDREVEKTWTRKCLVHKAWSLKSVWSDDVIQEPASFHLYHKKL